MAGNVLRRLLLAVPTLFGITLLVFLLLRAVPGDPVAYYIGQLGPGEIPQEIVQQLRQEYGLDRGPAEHYLRWLGSVARLDFGNSYTDRRPVLEKILEKLPATLLLNLVSLGLALGLAIPLGVRLARSPRADESVSLILIGLMSIPSFWAGLMLAEWLAVQWRLVPLYGTGAGGTDTLKHLALPAITLTYGQLAFFTRMVAASVREQISRPHAVAARARGASEQRVAWRYGFRPAAVTMVSILGIVLPAVLSGSIIVERLFAWDGIGRLFFDAVGSRDYPVVMALTFLTAVVVLLTNILVDVLYMAADPRAGARE